VGRLDDIIDRNKHPRRSRRKLSGRRGVGLAGVVLFLVLIALIFTNFAQPDDEPAPPRSRDHVPDVYLAKPPAKR
jgi:hypothetical protein